MLDSITDFVLSAIALATVFFAPIAGCIYIGDGCAKDGQATDFAKIGTGILYFAIAAVAAMYLSGAIMVWKG